MQDFFSRRRALLSSGDISLPYTYYSGGGGY